MHNIIIIYIISFFCCCFSVISGSLKTLVKHGRKSMRWCVWSNGKLFMIVKTALGMSLCRKGFRVEWHYIVGPVLIYVLTRVLEHFFLRLHIQDTQNTNMQIWPPWQQHETFSAESPCFSTRLSFQMSEEACLLQINCCIKLRLNSPVF